MARDLGCDHGGYSDPIRVNGEPALMWCRSCGAYARIGDNGAVLEWQSPAREIALAALIERLAKAADA